jgi:WD40 repeat protein
MRNSALSVVGAFFLAVTSAHAQQPMRELASDTQSVCSVAFSRDGKTIVAECCCRQFQLWDVETGKLRESWQTRRDDSVGAIADGWREVLFKLGINFTPRPIGIEARFHSRQRYVLSLAIDPAGSMLAACGRGSAVEVFDNHSGEKKWDLKFPKFSRENKREDFAVNAIAFHPAGTILAAGSSEGEIRFWSTKTGRVVASRSIGTGHGISSLAFNSSGEFLASGYYDTCDLDNGVAVWDVSNQKLSWRLKGHSCDVTCVAFSPDGRLLASVSGESWFAEEWEEPPSPGYEIKLWDLKTGALVRSITGHNGQATSVAFSPDGKLLVTGHRDDMTDHQPTGTLRVWDVEKLQSRAD